ncbi:hypothetical protein EYF80_041303 [Liparis tanakae]|uniref:Uncharacterized protein n=1 Tax=Liparis tanakae TaxID=230148 RepID=A0A4Z2G610_9TELE|nr:hypothetical protein EYF80_041303 [Liparis tanakae]
MLVKARSHHNPPACAELSVLTHYPESGSARNKLLAARGETFQLASLARTDSDDLQPQVSQEGVPTSPVAGYDGNNPDVCLNPFKTGEGL